VIFHVFCAKDDRPETLWLGIISLIPWFSNSSLHLLHKFFITKNHQPDCFSQGGDPYANPFLTNSREFSLTFSVYKTDRESGQQW